MSILSLIFTILLCPLAAFAIFGVLGLMGKRSPSQDLISTAAMLIAFVCSLLLFGQVLTNPDLQKPGGQIDSMVSPLFCLFISVFLFDASPDRFG